MKKYILLFLLSLSLYGTVIDYSKESDTKFMDSNTVENKDGKVNISDSVDNSSLIGDDTLPDKDIDMGLHYSENLGVATGTTMINTNGSTVYVKKNADGTPNTVISEDTIVTQDEKGESFDNYYNNYVDYVSNKSLEEKIVGESEARNTASIEVLSSGNTISDYTSRFMDSTNITSGSSTVATDMRINIQNSSLTGTEILDIEKDATRLYSENYSLDPSAANVDNIKNTNYGALTKAFNSLDSIKTALTNRLSKETIKCQISRQLIPSYRCPISSKAGALYPSGTDIDLIRKVNIQNAKNDCNDNCWTDKGDLSCLPKNILPSSDLDTSMFTGTTLYPNWDVVSSVTDIVTNQLMPVEYVKIKFEIKNDTSKSKMTDIEWEKYLYETNFKIRLSVLESNSKLTNNVDIGIVERMVVSLKSSVIEVEIPINKILSGLKIKFWEPYISDNVFYKSADLVIFDKLVNDYGSSINVISVESKYTSDSYYFCQAKQMVSHPNQCIGGKYEEFITGDDQSNFICSATSKKIGPEPTWGAFYSQDACETNCVVQKECEPTYSHYNTYGDLDFMFKSEFTCVDDEDNTACTVSICKALFAEAEKIPLNEIITLNDDTIVYTVKNKVLQSYARPKIDLSHEMSSSVDFDLLFQQEEKDAAYLYMLNNLTYNRIIYRLGTESPFNMAYIKQSSFGKTGISVKLKPASFDIDSGKNFYIYSVMKVEHSYSPIAGAWYVGGNTTISADPTNSNIQFKDITYAVKTGNTLNPWNVFRREEFAKILTEMTSSKVEEDGSITSVKYWDWVNSNQYKISSFGKYDTLTNSFNLIDKNQLAENFTESQFISDNEYNVYQLSNYIEEDLVISSGLLIKDQVSINHDSSFKKLYNTEEVARNESWPKNYSLYLVYSDVKLSYSDLMIRIEGDTYDSVKISPANNKYAVFDLVNPNSFRSDDIKYDSEINNNINTLIKGEADKTSVFVDWDPSISEKGKKVFKFLFLYDDTEKATFEYGN